MSSPGFQSSSDYAVALRWSLAARLNLLRPGKRSLSIVTAAVAVLLCGGSALALRGDLLIADGISYFCYSISLAICGIACVPFASREYGMLRLRWVLFSAGCFANSLSFVIAAMTRLTWLPYTTSQFYSIWFHALYGSLVLMSATVFFSRASSSMVALDILQGQLFGVLHFGLIFSPKARDLFAENHILIATLIAVFLFLTTMTASLGSASRGEARFLRLLAIFLGLQCIAVFLMNQVSFTWLHYDLASVWDIPETLFNMFFAFLAIRIYHQPESSTADIRPTLIVRSLMPSFLALGNLALGLVVLAYYPVLGVMAILFAVVCYVLRTVLLQTHSVQEHHALQEQNRQLQDLATRDTLTGIGNRRSLVAALTRLSRFQTQNGLAFVLVDTDWFKQANDQHGHQYGDTVLVAIADVLRSASESVPDGHCARLGGDEFALLLPNLDSGSVLEFAEGVRLRVKDLALKSGDRTISISLGVTVTERSLEFSLENLISRADEALYRAKSMGRNRVEIWA